MEKRQPISFDEDAFARARRSYVDIPSEEKGGQKLAAFYVPNIAAGDTVDIPSIKITLD